MWVVWREVTQDLVCDRLDVGWRMDSVKDIEQFSGVAPEWKLSGCTTY